VFVAASLAAVAAGGGLVALYLARLASAFVLLGWVLVTFRRAVGPLDTRVDAGELRAFVGQGWAFGSTVLFGVVIAQADVLMLQLACSEDEVARYAAPASVLLQLGMVPTILSSGLFPRLARLGAGDPALRRELSFQTRMMLLGSLPVAVGGAVVAGPLLALLFGEPYRDAAVPAAVLLLTVPIRFLHHGYGMALTAIDRQSVRARAGGIAAAINVVANVVAIPLLGAEGAALTTFLTDAALLFGLWLAVRDQLDGAAERDAWVRTLLPALAMGAVVAAVPGLHVLLRIGLGAAVYGALVVATGGLKRADLVHLHRV
jgi:O-antigen/teichoic acid export membrane protein